MSINPYFCLFLLCIVTSLVTADDESTPSSSDDEPDSQDGPPCKPHRDGHGHGPHHHGGPRGGPHRGPPPPPECKPPKYQLTKELCQCMDKKMNECASELGLSEQN